MVGMIVVMMVGEWVVVKDGSMVEPTAVMVVDDLEMK